MADEQHTEKIVIRPVLHSDGTPSGHYEAVTRAQLLNVNNMAKYPAPEPGTYTATGQALQPLINSASGIAVGNWFRIGVQFQPLELDLWTWDEIGASLAGAFGEALGTAVEICVKTAGPKPDDTAEPLLSLDAATAYAGRAAGILSRLDEPTEASRADLERWAIANAQVSVAMSLSALVTLLAERGGN